MQRYVNDTVVKINVLKRDVNLEIEISNARVSKKQKQSNQK